MASRWRSWDLHFATDVLESQISIEPLNILPVGGRGKRQLNIPASLLTIPFIQESFSSDIDGAKKGSGRGRRLRNVNKNDFETNCKIPALPEHSLLEVSKRMEVKKLQDDKEWPSLNPNKNNSSKNKNIPSSGKQNVKNSRIFSSKKKTDNEFVFSNNNLDIERRNSVELENTYSFLKTKTARYEEVSEQFADDFNDSFLLLKDKIDKAVFTSTNDEVICDTILEEKQLALSSNIEKTEKLSEKEVEMLNDRKGEKQDLFLGLDLNSSSQATTDNHSRKSDVKDFTDNDFLSTLENCENYILIENIPIDSDDEVFQECISSCGDIVLFQTQKSENAKLKSALIKMDSSSHCDWVISCLDGDMYDGGDKRLSVRRVEDIIESNKCKEYL